MNLKKIFKLSVLPSLLLTNSFSAYALGDVIAGFGYSRYDYNDTSGPSTEKGNNLNATVLWSLFGINPIASIVVGPMLKSETVSAGIQKTFLQKETFTTTQLGAEGGIKINLIPALSLYGIYFASYGISNKLSEDVTGDGIIVSNQTVNPSVSQSWQTGIKLRGLYNVNSLWGLGLGFEMANGAYKYDSSSIVDNFGGNIPVASGENKYTSININLQVALFL